MRDHGLGVDVIINDIQLNLRCTHGPTILFERFQNDRASKKFYACSACRDRRHCSFFHLADQKFSKAKEEVWRDFIKKATSKFTHSEVFNRSKAIKALPAAERNYCCDCSQLLGEKQKCNHKSHTLKSPVTDEHLQNPSTLLPPKESPRFEAQYLFAPSSIQVLMGMLDQLQAVKVLCVGAPRIFEAIVNAPQKKMSALLLDIDERYSAFFTPEQFLYYNMFNHFFFGGENAQQTYNKFISGSEKLVIVSDPPFGGRMELLGLNLLTIQSDWRNANKLTKEDQLSVMFIFPYFLEPQVLEQLPNFTMLDFQVDYDNHPLYSSGMKGMINGSAVRVFVNDRPSLFALPEGKGYRHCKICDRWVRANNIHCEKCNGCMAKDGRTYKHCDDCSKCVKPSWNHCSNCQKCQPQDHNCVGVEINESKSFACHICGKEGHKRMDCPKRKRTLSPLMSHPKNKRRKLEKKMENKASTMVITKGNGNENGVSKKNTKLQQKASLVSGFKGNNVRKKNKKMQKKAKIEMVDKKNKNESKLNSQSKKKNKVFGINGTHNQSNGQPSAVSKKKLYKMKKMGKKNLQKGVENQKTKLECNKISSKGKPKRKNKNK